MCKAPLQVALSSLSPVLCFLALPHVVLEAAGWVVVAFMHNLYEIRRPSCAMSHELGINAVQLFTKSRSVIYSIDSLGVIHPLMFHSKLMNYAWMFVFVAELPTFSSHKYNFIEIDVHICLSTPHADLQSQKPAICQGKQNGYMDILIYCHANIVGTYKIGLCL